MAAPDFRTILARTASILQTDGNALSALTGLFICLPSAILFWIVLDAPQLREATEQIDPEQMAILMQERGLIMLPFALLPLLGQLSIAAFLLDHARPTVGGAIGKGLRLFLPFLALVMLLQIALQLAGGLLMALGIVGQILLFGLAIFLSMRLFLLPAVFAARGSGIVGSLRESWALSGGEFWKAYLPLIFGMLGAFFLGMIALTLLVLPARALLGIDAEILITALLTGLVIAALSLYATLFSVSAYRALSGSE